MKNKGCLIAAGVALILITCGIAYYFVQQNKSTDEETKTVKAEITNIIKKAVATGSINPRQEVNIKPQVSGVIDKLYMEAGELIKKGDKIARIKLIPSEVNINSAQSSVELARLQVKNAERELARQKSVADQNLDQQEAKSAYENANVELERNTKLFKDGVISETDFNTFKLDADIRKSAYENAKINSGNAVSSFEADLDIRRQELNAAISNLQLLREGATKNSKQVSNIVVSTLDGMILDIPVKEGASVIERNTFNEGTSIATIADMSNLIFEGQVDEADVGKLKENMALELKVGAIDDVKFDAILEFISPKGVEEEGTIKFVVKAAIKEYSEDVFLRAGYSANADIILDKRDSVLAINERDIIYAGDTTFIELIKDNDELDKIEVELGLSDGILVELMDSPIDTTQKIKMRVDSGKTAMEN